MFLPELRNFQDNLKDLLDEKVQDTIKLAKWDNLSTYSLIDHSDKVHRSLNKYLREYEADVLDYPFSLLLRKAMIGNFVSEQGELIPISEMPSIKETFPHAWNESTAPAEFSLSASGIVLNRSISGDLPSRLLQADKLFHTFSRILANTLSALTSENFSYKVRPASQLTLKADALCLDIFERIERLRESQSSKSIKYRSIHDMFSTLKFEGFSHLRSDVVSDMRNFEHLLSTPGVLSQTRLSELCMTEGDYLHKSELYFVRNVAELNQFGAQISSPYSKDISPRDVSQMIGYSENMLQKVSSLLFSI